MSDHVNDRWSEIEAMATVIIGEKLGKLSPSDPTNPDHYKQHPSGIEAIDVAEHMSFNLGNVVKYVMRAGLKGDAVEDLSKARWYLQREIERLENKEQE